MARKIKISASALNVRLHPHSSQIYADWIGTIFSGRLIAQVHGDRHGMISMIDRSGAGRGVIAGIITTFVKLDDGGTWFNVEQLAEATEEQISTVNIPQNLYPNASTFYFYFDTVEHKLYFQTYSNGKVLTPPSMLKFFSALSRDLRVMSVFGEAKISIVQDQASLEKMFSIKRIKEIEITILKPNTDVFDEDFEKNIEKHLEDTKSSQFTVTYKAEANGSIKPDDDINKISKVALENGSVNVIGRDEKGAVRLNSVQFPKELHDKFDPDTQSERSAFLSLIPPRAKANE
ncbi:DUF4747 family protein [Mesorhizobium abyssinicae]|uniref:DUF4747 family protein n=1 Tax=Mesorhizobium abyssinicae TaxID=1209958 RepID=UPI002A2473C7|nr:DUF4747 family protein [Mesorhizobium abyssinicae]MDX8436591.1 DUF4747 family protein [Mesorhizobium abyssinicae]